MNQLLRHNRAKYYFLFLLLITSISCEKEANIAIQEVDAQIVINSNFTPNEPFLLELSKSSSVFSTTTAQTLEDADIQVCKGIICQKLVASSIGNDNLNKVRYTSERELPEAGIQYSLKIEIEGMEKVVSAEAMTPEKVDLTHVAIGAITEIPLEDDPIDEKQYDARISLQFDDPAGEDNYYQINFYQESIDNNGNQVIDPETLKPVGIENFIAIDQDIVDLRNITDNGILLNDRHFDGQTRDLFFRPIFKYNPTTELPVNIVVELRTVSKAYYDYYSSVYKQVNQGSDPFSQPVEIISNIKNGLGVFAGYSKDVMVREIEF